MRILIAEDDESTRKGIQSFLESEGSTVTATANGAQAWDKLKSNHFDLVISDIKMPEMDGLELLSRIQSEGITVPVIIMTAFATVEGAVKAIQNGAEDYLTKPLNLDELTVKIRRIQAKTALMQENQRLKKRLKNLEFPEMIGTSRPIREIQNTIIRLNTDPNVTVTIHGESGTGKELVARTIHQKSPRAAHPFVAINCAAFTDTLLESELFGHKKGAFTGAHQDKAGFCQAAHQGTLFLDEVGEMSTRMQTKLLRFLQEKTFQPVGSTKPIQVDVRIISASNQDLHQLMEQGTFREDLFYRLNVMELVIPPLRERKEDIPLLLRHFLDTHNANREKPIHFSRELFEYLEEYAWPGNVRELDNLVRKLTVICETSEVTIQDLPEKLRSARDSHTAVPKFETAPQDYKTALNQVTSQFEESFLQHHLDKHGGNISKCAEAIGISRVALHQKIKHHQLRVT